jgi:hypothetical protein
MGVHPHPHQAGLIFHHDGMYARKRPLPLCVYSVDLPDLLARSEVPYPHSHIETARDKCALWNKENSTFCVQKKKKNISFVNIFLGPITRRNILFILIIIAQLLRPHEIRTLDLAGLAMLDHW